MKLIAQIAGIGLVAGTILAATAPKKPVAMSIDDTDYEKMEKLDPYREMNGKHATYVLKPEQVAKVYPELVHKGADGKVEVNYQQLTIVLLRQVMDLRQQVNALEDFLIVKE